VTPEPPPLRQAWVPRVVNVTLAVVLLACLSPAVYRFGGHPVWVQVLLVLVCLPLLLLAAACLASAARPGSLGRLARKLRSRRS
jgi:threonine/homoserine/homoserine lactone efflux protein